VRGLIFCFIFSGCVTHSPDPVKTDWEAVYEHELEVAKENEDLQAWMFFWPEYLKERERKREEKKKLNNY
jgi:hypothetical protein